MQEGRDGQGTTDVRGNDANWRGERGSANEQLATLQGLFVLAQLMSESKLERRILQLAGTAVRSLGQYQLVGIHLSDSGWQDHLAGTMLVELEQVESQLDGLTGPGGRVTVANYAWSWAFALRSLQGEIGHLVLGADADPSPWETFLAGTLTQLTAMALVNTRMYVVQHAQATELQEANEALAITVAALEHSSAIHERLTRIAVAGDGEQGIAEALSVLTGWPVAIEDRYGNLRAWGGPARVEPYPKVPASAREALIRRASDLGQPVQEGDRLLAVASPRADVLGVITIVGVPAGEIERARVPLEHATTVLALELSRLQSVAETELRLGRDLVDELLAGTDERAALSRAQALSYDLRRRHWVGIVVEHPSRLRGDPDQLSRVVRRAAVDTGLGALVVPRGDTVVVLCANGKVWSDFHRQLTRELGRTSGSELVAPATT